MHAEEETRSAGTDRVILGLPVDTGILFSDKKGVYKPGIEKARTKLLQKLGFLGRFLDADEKIILATTGCSPFTMLEQMTFGAAWVMAVKRSLFVFTTKRLFHIPATTSGKYRGSISQILYQDCRRLHVKGSMLVAEYPNGKTEKFYGLPGGDRAIIKNFKLEASQSDRPSDSPQRNHLCPSCTQVLPTGAVACPSCGFAFKDKAKALKYSVLIPGGGYFYANHPFIGVGDALVESYLTIVTLVASLAAILGDPEAMGPAIMFGVILVLEKLVSIHHSNSFLAEFIPLDLKSILSAQTVQAEPPAPVPTPTPQRAQRPEDVLSVR